jgi:predicted nucleic acid-binding protein
MIWIFDSSPLIYMNKVGLNWIFEQLEGEKFIPAQVYEQVVTRGKIRGKIRGDADAIISEELVKKRVIKVIIVENGFKAMLDSLKDELHEGELEVLALAKNKRSVAVLDESIAREVGRVFKIEVHGTLFLIFLMVRMMKLKKEEAREKVNLMIREGFRLGHEEYLGFLNLLDNA